MSTWAFAVLTKKRAASAPKGTSSTTSPPGMGTYIDMVAAIVPAEVLALHAVVLSLTSKISLDQAGNTITTITHPKTLGVAFYALLFFSVALYLLPRPPLKKLLDYFRAVIPPFAFVAWTMLQKPSAFDVVCPKLEEVPRLVAGALAAALLAAIAKSLADKADK